MGKKLQIKYKLNPDHNFFPSFPFQDFFPNFKILKKLLALHKKLSFR